MGDEATKSNRLNLYLHKLIREIPLSVAIFEYRMVATISPTPRMGVPEESRSGVVLEPSRSSSTLPR